MSILFKIKNLFSVIPLSQVEFQNLIFRGLVAKVFTVYVSLSLNFGTNIHFIDYSKN
jgi:hypothetical protein